ncbi:hypothetical protein RYX36_032284, partial [Vicia faba]
QKNMEICFWVVDLISREEDGDMFVDYGFVSRGDFMAVDLMYSTILRRCAISR